ncbi:MAG: trehalose-phosphatase [Xanthobacteraceae bacterium]|nr:trehalose-phosphatase [Xanthobacteraceae bacterium]
MPTSIAETSAPTLIPDVEDWAILLDVDGTILDLAPTPRDIRVPPSLRETLERIKMRTSGAIALVSGRTLNDLDGIFAPLKLAAIGGHGAELRPGPESAVHRSNAQPLDPALRMELAAIATVGSGILFEDKGYSLALHYRLAPEKGPFVCETVAAISRRASQRLELLEGTNVIEVKHLGFSKGTAVRELMAHAPFAGRRPIFIGDDTTDQAAFAVMPQFSGIAISVRRRVTGVDFHFDTPNQVRAWLERIAPADAGATA